MPENETLNEVCMVCESEYKTVDSCIEKIYTINGSEYDPVKFKAINPRSKCPECGVIVGGLHHYGCGRETCPRCKGLVTSCNCDYKESEEDEEYNDLEIEEEDSDG